MIKVRKFFHSVLLFTAGVLAVVCASFSAYAACSNNEEGQPGQAGEIEYFSDNMMRYCDGTNWVDMNATPPAPTYTPNGVVLDGGDWMKRGGALTGVVDGKSFTAALWIKFNSSGDWQRVFSGPAGTDRLSIGRNDYDELVLRIADPAESIFSSFVTTNIVTDGNWHHVMYSFDAAAGISHVYVDGKRNGAVYNLQNVTYDFTLTDWAVGVDPQNNWNPFNGEIADLWIDFNTYIDLSIPANRQRFYNYGPVNLGATGQLPTGSSPDVFLSGATASWPTNDGTAGGFTLTGTLATSATTPPAGSYEALPVNLNNGLVSKWQLNETTGSTIVDNISGYNGTWSDGSGNSVAEETSVGKIGRAIDFDGSNDYVAIADNANFTLNATGGYTWSSWIYVDAIKDWPTLFSHTNASEYVYFYVGQTASDGGLPGGTVTNGITAYWDSNGENLVREAEGVITTGTWQHVVITYDGSVEKDIRFKIYVDGNDVSGQIISNGGDITSVNPTNIQIGGNSLYPAETFNGRIDDMRFYNRVLNSAEVTALYQQGDSGLIGHWKLDETSGTVAADSSGHGYTGSMQNGLSGSSNSIPAIVKNGLQFDGADDHIDTTVGDLLDTASQATICAWINPDDLNSDYAIVSDAQQSAGLGWLLFFDKVGFSSGRQNIISFASGGSTSNRVETPADSARANEWQQYCVTYMASTYLRIYRNGVLVDQNTTASPSSLSLSGQTFTIGARTSGGDMRFKGGIDDVRVYNRALSASEIGHLANCTGPGIYFYNDVVDAMQWCDGENAAYNMGAPASGSGGCTGGIEGGMRFQTDRYQFCDGNGWVDIGK